MGLGIRVREASPHLQSIVPSVLSQVSPVPEVRDADQLDDINSYLTKKNEEEHEEAERVVGPVERERDQKSQEGLGLVPQHSTLSLTFLLTRSQDAGWESRESSRGPATLPTRTHTERALRPPPPL